MLIHGPGNWFGVAKVRDRFPVATRFSALPESPWGPPSLLYNGYRVFPGGKVRPGSAADHSPSSKCRGHGRVELYLYPLSGPHRACNGITLHFNYHRCWQSLVSFSVIHYGMNHTCYEVALITFLHPNVCINLSFTKMNTLFVLLTSLYRDRGSTVVKVLYHKSEGRWFDPSWCHCNFSFT